MKRPRLWQILIILFLVGFTNSCSLSGNSNLPAKRVLFIGNSFTAYNGGLDKLLTGLAPNTFASGITSGGYTLQQHWESADTLAQIQSGDWDIVILQEQSQNSIINYYNFFEYAKKLNAEIEKSGAETIIFMTWERPDSIQYNVTTQALYKAYTALGQQLNVKVAPVGLAFANALKERPDLKLYVEDGHPTLAGSYLASCVFYEIIYGESPVGNSFDAELSSEDIFFLQNIAAKTLGQ
ncbi:MAG: hypothetical protein UZ14_CFX002000554 [Chloroflexi bacterium OLB14]|nr:MAG: hypothetical protein UZ14_CFX002000554 [Chloroflexi bacterium OLB14]